MILVYDRKDGRVLSTMSTNHNLGDELSAAVSSMFPDLGSHAGYCEVDVRRVPRVCQVELVEGVVVRVYGSQGDVYRIDPGELKRCLEEKKKDEGRRLLGRMPYRADAALANVVFDVLPSLQQTAPEVLAAIKDNSYFHKEVKPVGWWGSFTDAGGYANMNREYVQRLHNHWILPYISMYPTISQVDRQTENVLKALAALRPRSSDHPYVYAFTPMPHPPHPGRRIFYTMMETSTLHPDFVRCCNDHCDEIWVPSKANMELFSGQGVKKKMRVLPLGIDEGLYLSGTNPVPLDLSKTQGLFGRSPSSGVNSFRFLSVIQWNFRKGFDALLRAFVDAFTAKDDVALVFATQYSRETVLGDLIPFLPRTDNLPQVLLCNHIVPIREMPALYAACQCYAHLSRGEGFSLTQIEAAACSLPVLSCFHSGMTEYLRDDNSYLVRCPDREKCHPRLAAISYFYQGQDLWKVGPRQVSEAAQLMRHIIDNPGEAAARAAILRKDVEERYTWKKAAERVADVLRKT